MEMLFSLITAWIMLNMLTGILFNLKRCTATVIGLVSNICIFCIFQYYQSMGPNFWAAVLLASILLIIASSFTLRIKGSNYA